MDSKWIGEAGVYRLTHIPTGKYYIGATKDLYHRYYSHISGMKYQYQTANTELKRLWQETPNEESFQFRILQTCEPTKAELNRQEQRYLNVTTRDSNCINTVSRAYRSRFGHTCTEKHKANLSKSQVERRGNRKWNVRLVSPEGKVYETNNVAKLAREHGLSQPLLNAVACGKQYHHKRWTLEGNEMKVIDNLTLSDFKGNRIEVTNENWDEVCAKIGADRDQFRMFLYKPERHAIEPGWYKLGYAEQTMIVENESGEEFVLPDLNGAKRIFCLKYGLDHSTWCKMKAKKRIKTGEFANGWRIKNRRMGD